MKLDIKYIIIFFVLASISMNCARKESIYAKKVNPFIGTGGHGHTYPGVSAPFGMVQLSPDTRVEGWDACSGYHFSDSSLFGFSHTHLSGTGAADYGDILFTPRTKINSIGKIGFSHDKEKAWAGYYAVALQNNIDVRLTSTTRVGIHEYEFNNDSSFIFIDLNHGIGPDRLVDSHYEITEPTEITGFRRSSGWAKDQIVYFTAQFSEPLDLVQDSNDDTKIHLSFGKLQQALIAKVGLSSVSVENARENIDKEAPGWDFEHYIQSAEKVWDKQLGKVKASFLTKDEDTTFYTSLYHSFLAPNTFSDVSGEYRGMDSTTYSTTGTHYTVFSLWDTFRATHPLFTILDQARNVNMINSMLEMHEQQGLLPVWELASNETGTMIGYHAIPVIADAMVKKLSGFDYDLALNAMVASAREEHLGLKYYSKMGYIPAEKEHESVSKTLEYAYDDWCIAQAANILGDDDIEKEFNERAQFYKNLYDPLTGFMRPKRNGNWISNFDPFEVSGNYTEANAWQYNLFVPQDIDNLNDLYGSSTSLAIKLDSLFNATSEILGRQQPDIAGMIGQYAHGNEPSHNFAYLYNYVDQPWKTQELVHRINTELYQNSPDGLSGNEDCGQMSSWYVFSTLGFYPAIPGKAEYVLGTPSVKKATLRMESGVSFIVETENLSKENYYVQSVILNNQPLNRSFITHDEIMKGGKLLFTMGDKPAKKWMEETIVAPSSEIAGEKITITPIINGGEMTFLDSATIEIYSIEKDVDIFYSFDGSNPDKNSNKYLEPFKVDTSTLVKAIAIKKDRLLSKISEASFIKIPYGRKIEIKNPYSHLYTGNSQMALIDHIHGLNNFRDGWQGYHEVDLEAIVDLGKVREVDSVSAGFLQDHYSWIFYPKELIIELSIDGHRFDHKKIIKNTVDADADGLITQLLGTNYQGVKARYVKIKAVNMGTCPEWHKGAGHQAWLFADEININTK